jgi:superfamily II DNA or RNA helicase
MIKINTISPTKTYITEGSIEILSMLRKDLTFSDTSVAFNLKKLKDNKWLQQNHPATYDARVKELQAKLKTCMLKRDEDGFSFHPGSIPYLSGYDFIETGDGIQYPVGRKMPWRKPLPFDLYPYQEQSLQKLIEAKHGCVELCTGAGKTAIILSLARELGLKTVIVTPSKSIFLEMLHKFEYHFGKTNVGAYGSGKKKIGKKFTVCVSKSLTMLKKGTKEYDFFSDADVVISDESHLNAANTLEETFHGVLKDVPYRFFLSGTQVRGDGKDKLLEAIIGKKVHELTTKEAVDGGYICPVSFTVLETRTDNINPYSDPLKAKRNHLLYNENIANIIAKMANGAWKHAQESTLVLVEELKQIKMLVDKLNVPYEYVHSASKADAAKYGLETRKVDQAVEAFNKGEVKILIGTSCIATGTNIYPTHNTINWVGGSSEVRTKQGAVGRSVRLLEKSEFKDLHKQKPISKIYDFRLTNVPKRRANSKPDILENHLQKRISMYKETNKDIRYIRVG